MNEANPPRLAILVPRLPSPGYVTNTMPSHLSTAGPEIRDCNHSRTRNNTLVVYTETSVGWGSLPPRPVAGSPESLPLSLPLGL